MEDQLDAAFREIELKKQEAPFMGLTGREWAVRIAAFTILMGGAWIFGKSGQRDEDQKIIDALIVRNDHLEQKLTVRDAPKANENPREMILRLTKTIECDLDQMEQKLADPKLGFEEAVQMHFQALAWDIAINYAFIRGDEVRHDRIRGNWILHRMVMEKMGRLKDIPGTGDAVPHHELKDLFVLRDRASILAKIGFQKAEELRQAPQKEKAKRQSRHSGEEHPSRFAKVHGLDRIPAMNRQAS
jgi:hypothetical protein